MDAPIFHDIVGRSRQIRRVIKRIQNVASLDVPVLIAGESGVGKELVARAIHDESARKNGPFQAINSGAVPTDLVASELFGHEKGAFTGATTTQPGFLEAAKGGTLFLDEIATMGEALQVSLLRVLETNQYSRVGGSGARKTDIRVIAATNERLGRGRKLPSLRKDLFYRLSVFTINVPPLRERRDDIPLLVHHFLTQVGRRVGKRMSGVEPAAMRQLKSYGWPGNIRELINVMTRVIISSPSDTVTEATTVEALYAGPIEQPEPAAADSGGSDEVAIQPGQSIEDAERELIRVTLNHVDGNRTKAAKLLGISRKSLYNKIKQYDLDT